MLETIVNLVDYLIGGIDAFLYAFFAFVIIDYITGVTSAAINGKLSSAIGYKGIVKKVLMLVLVIVATILDDLYSMNGVLRKAVVTALVINEGVSILSNLKECGVNIPSMLATFLSSAKTSNDGTELTVKTEKTATEDKSVNSQTGE